MPFDDKRGDIVFAEIFSPILEILLHFSEYTYMKRNGLCSRNFINYSERRIMQTLDGYQHLEEIYKNGTSLIYRAHDEKNDRPVIIKILNIQYPATEDMVRFNKEYELMNKLKNEGVPEVYEKSVVGNSPLIVMEDIHGLSLDVLLGAMKLHTDEFLYLAVQIAEIVGNIHKHNVIHKDINPSNIIWNIKKRCVRIIDMGNAAECPREVPPGDNSGILEGTLAYMSPEQTGRMNRSLDYRTDIYSLGVTFYWMLTGRLPFESSDALQLVHAHIAIEPLPPSDVDSLIPRAVSDIVMKMMAKNPEDRYLSAHGLKSDLEHCIRDLRDAGVIHAFPLGSRDVSDRFQIPFKLYGREDDTAYLMEAFQRVREGTNELLLVSGFAGIGKSILIDQLRGPIVSRSGYFIKGKFEQLKKHVPYSAITQAFTSFARAILTEDETDIGIWKDKILAALGPNGKIVTEIIPLFELIIGKQGDIPHLGHVESQNRFNLVFRAFLKILAGREHPLVIFLDDLQWADMASLHLLKEIATDSDIRSLLIIGAYRHDETPASHPLILHLDEIRKSGTMVNDIFLQPLNSEHINQLLQDTLRNPPEPTHPLAEILLKKTDGNPFFITEFINTLYRERLIEFSFSKGWSWDMTGIMSMQASDNVIDLIADKIADLPQGSQEMVKLGACMDNSFTLELLAAVSGHSYEHILSALNPVLHDGMLNLIDDTYTFSHDRIFETAYSLIPDAEKKKLHYRIGNHLLRVTGKDERNERIFSIVNQLNAGVDLIGEEAERRGLSELNVSAGKKAFASNAFESALNYFRIGIELLDSNIWSKDYGFALELFSEGAVAAQRSAEYEVMNRLSEEVLNNAASVLDTVKIYNVKMSASMVQGRLQESIMIGLAILGKLGVKLPEKPGIVRITRELLSVKISLIGKSIRSLIDLPYMNDSHKLAILQLLSNLGASAYFSTSKLLLLIIITIVKMSVKYGNSIYSPFAYVALGTIYAGVLGDVKSGYNYGMFGLQLLEKYSIKDGRSKVMFIFWCFINHWQKPIRDSLQPYLEGYLAALETGDLYFAALSVNAYSCNLFYAGSDLVRVEKEMGTYSEAIKKLKQDMVLDIQLIPHQAVLNLQGKSADPSTLIGTSYDEGSMLMEYRKAGNETALFVLNYFKLYLKYLFGKYAEALMYSDRAELHIDAVTSSPYIPLYCFYDSLVRLALCSGAKKGVRRKYLKQVSGNQKKMRKWAFQSPENYRHKYHLVEAEINRIKKREHKAKKLYKSAVQEAHESKYFQEEALALELTAGFWLDLDENKIASLYMVEACNVYRSWGATAKVMDIEKQYSPLLNSWEENIAGTLKKTKTVTGAAESLDIVTIIKTSQFISGEIDLAKLLEKVMRVSIENSGAQRGLLILDHGADRGLFVEAEGTADANIEVLKSIPLEKIESLSKSVVRYVHRTGENLILNNAYCEGDFTNDSYIQKNKIKSLLCMPITFQGKTTGILYLENSITAHAFTRARIELLRIISSQAAVSIENARLLVEREQTAMLAKEIETAGKIQRSLLPKEIPVIPDVSIAYKYIPMMRVGGDFVNIHYKKERGKIGLFICDVSGHGVPAALTASMVSYALDIFWDTCFDTPSLILKEMGASLKNKMGGNFFTGCICSFDCMDGSLVVSSAGHPPMVVIRHCGNMEMIETNGRFISEYFASSAEDATLKLDKGDMLVLYTDGITEAKNQRGEMLGSNDEQFCGWLKKIYDISSSPDEFCENIYKGIIDHTGSNQFEDDVTILVLHYG